MSSYACIVEQNVHLFGLIEYQFNSIPLSKENQKKERKEKELDKKTKGKVHYLLLGSV
jgi:hypothetical protein